MLNHVVKRIMDTFIALLGLLLLSPILILLCVLIPLDSTGSPLFFQTRVGRRGHKFRMIKFRSMFIDGGKRLENPEILEKIEASGKVLKMQDDPRVTRIGKILRTTSLDELPQLINIFLGHMSLVGPRALIPSMLDPYPDWAKARAVVRPGLTGLWQVSARERNESLADMIDYDLEYIRNWSLWQDIVIVAKTPRAVISGKGAV